MVKKREFVIAKGGLGGVGGIQRKVFECTKRLDASADGTRFLRVSRRLQPKSQALDAVVLEKRRLDLMPGSRSGREPLCCERAPRNTSREAPAKFRGGCRRGKGLPAVSEIHQSQRRVKG